MLTTSLAQQHGTTGSNNAHPTAGTFGQQKYIGDVNLLLDTANMSKLVVPATPRGCEQLVSVANMPHAYNAVYLTCSKHGKPKSPLKGRRWQPQILHCCTHTCPWLACTMLISIVMHCEHAVTILHNVVI